MTDDLTQSPRERFATEMANDLRRKLEHSTPAELGWPEATAAELVDYEYRCWLHAEHFNA